MPLLLASALLSHQSQVSGLGAPIYTNVTRYYAPWNDNYAGAYKLVGKTIAGSAPYAAHVMVYPHNAPSVCIRDAMTDSITGTFTFNNLAAGRYLIAAIDTTGTYRMVNYSLVAAVPM